ncbi:MAG: hypothetical protein E6J83_09465 [Deltaproteobacteria bacterium]|nr:MAG: hypothetical protein E6J83_09465 [Deltaproteobacteria bacterium]
MRSARARRPAARRDRVGGVARAACRLRGSPLQDLLWQLPRGGGRGRLRLLRHALSHRLRRGVHHLPGVRVAAGGTRAMNDRLEVLVAGCGAIGWYFAALLDLSDGATFGDVDRVMPENLGVSGFTAEDLGKEKAAVLAGRRRAQGGLGRALVGDLRYTLRPGLARALGCAVLCLDNPRAVRDAAEVLWSAGSGHRPVLVLTCGSEAQYQVRLFDGLGPCPVCLFGAGERHADRTAEGATCSATSAPRASAAAAEAAARAGAELLARWRAGERSLANCRIQRDAAGAEAYTIRLPAAPSPGCPVPHSESSDAHEPLGAIAEVTVGALAERAIGRAGDDAVLLLGRRAVPLAGIYCPD